MPLNSTQIFVSRKPGHQFRISPAMSKHPDAPLYGFTIMSDGSILRGQPGTFDEEQVRYWYNKWLVMKCLGVFDNKQSEEQVDQGGSSSSSTYIPIPVENGDKFNEKGIEQKPVDPVVPKSSDNKSKKNKKKSTGKNKKGRK